SVFSIEHLPALTRLPISNPQTLVVNEERPGAGPKTHDYILRRNHVSPISSAPTTPFGRRSIESTMTGPRKNPARPWNSGSVTQCQANRARAPRALPCRPGVWCWHAPSFLRVQEEADHLGRGVGSGGVGVAAIGAPSGPGVACALDPPGLDERRAVPRLD